MRFPARLVFVFASIVLFLSLFAVPVTHAQQTNPYTVPDTESGVPKNIHTLTQSVFLSTLSSFTCILSGVDIATPTHQCLGVNAKTGKIGYATNNGGLMGMISGGIAATFTPPFHTAEYTHYLTNNFGLIKNTYAANGTGFDQLSPIMKIWIAIRNLAYLIFVIVFVGIGFAIMVRAKIDPRTVMTIENQLPKLVIALLLVTFSFAIAGLMIDVTWVVIFFVINLFASLDPQLHDQLRSITGYVNGSPYDWFNTFNSGFGGFLGIAGQAAGAVKDISNTIAIGLFAQLGVLKVLLAFTVGLPIVLSCMLGSALGVFHQAVSNVPILGFFTGTTGGSASPDAFGACLDGGLATLVSSIGWVIAFIIFSFAIIIALGKLWWSLIKSYSLFIVYVIFGPLMIMGGVLPGSKINFENWLRHIAAYLLVFPTAMAILLLGKTIMDAYSTNSTGYVPPLLGISPSVSSSLGPILGFAILMLVPQSLTIVQDALAAPDMKYLAGVGQSIGSGAQAYSGLMMRQFNRGMRARNLVEGLDEGWIRRRIPKTLKGILFGKPDAKSIGQGSGTGDTKVPS